MFEEIIDKDKMYKLTICFTNGIKKLPLKVLGYVILEMFKQTDTGVFCIATDKAGCLIPMQSVNEIYWQESNEDNESEESIN